MSISRTSPLPPPRKRFGQHFLHDPAVIDRIVRAIGPTADHRLVEIGPGRGALTGALLRAGGSLDAVEIDRDLARLLPGRLGITDARLRVHCVDALKFELAGIVAPGTCVDVIGNLPYNISTPLLFHLLGQTAQIRKMVFMLQKEVVERIAAPPGGKQYGRLSVMVQYHCEVEHLFNIGPGAFHPPPKVESAVVRLTPRQRSGREYARDPAALSALVKRAFSTRRKTLRNALKGLCTETALLNAGIDPQARAETLGVADFVRLANLNPESDMEVM